MPDSVADIDLVMICNNFLLLVSINIVTESSIVKAGNYGLILSHIVGTVKNISNKQKGYLQNFIKQEHVVKPLALPLIQH